MGWKIRMADTDGTETFIDTADLFDKGVFSCSAPLLPRFKLDLRGVFPERDGSKGASVERGVWLQIGVYDAANAPTLKGHDPRRSPQCAMAYDLPLVDGDGLERLACIEWDGKVKLMRVRDGLVDVAKMDAAFERLVGGRQEDRAFTDAAFQTFCALVRQRRAAWSDQGRVAADWPGQDRWEWKPAEDKEAAFFEIAQDIASEMGWPWSELEPIVRMGGEELIAEEEARECARAADDEEVSIDELAVGGSLFDDDGGDGEAPWSEDVDPGYGGDGLEEMA